MSIYNNLSDDEEERVAIYMEESGESLQEIGKILRHGYESFNPFDPDKTTNRTRLTKEVADMIIACKLLLLAGDIDENLMKRHIAVKILKMRKYIHDPKNLDLLQRIAVELGVDDCQISNEERNEHSLLELPLVVLPMA